MLDLERLEPETVRLFTRSEYDRMVELGLFDDERVELLRGVIVRMSPQDTRHAEAVRRLIRMFVLAVGERAVVSPQLSFAASDDSEPEPDLALLPPGDYTQAHPAQAPLVVEVANTSLRKDRGVKAELYAEVGIPEYWIVNLVARDVEVLRAPEGGRYTERVVRRPGEVISPLALPDVEVSVADIVV